MAELTQNNVITFAKKKDINKTIVNFHSFLRICRYKLIPNRIRFNPT